MIPKLYLKNDFPCGPKKDSEKNISLNQQLYQDHLKSFIRNLLGNPWTVTVFEVENGFSVVLVSRRASKVPSWSRSQSPPNYDRTSHTNQPTNHPSI